MQRRATARPQPLERLVLPDQVRERIFAGFLHDNGTALGQNELRSNRFHDSSNAIIAWRLDDGARRKLRTRVAEDRTLSRLTHMLTRHIENAPTGAVFLFHRGDRIKGLDLWLELDGTERLENARVFDSDKQVDGKLPAVVDRISNMRGWMPHGVMGGRCMIISDGKFAHVHIGYSASSDYDTLNTVRVMPSEVSPRDVVVYSAINQYAEEPTADMLKQLLILSESGANTVLIVGHNRMDGKIGLQAWCLMDRIPSMTAALIEISAQAAWNAAMRIEDWEVSDLCMPMELMVQLARNWGIMFDSAITGRIVRQIPIVGADGRAIEIVIPLDEPVQ